MNRSQIHNAYVGTLTIVLSFGIVFLYLTALKYHLFFFHPWLDIPLHFLGGIVIAALSYFISLSATSEADRRLPTSAYIISIFLSVFIIGIFWEVYEVFFGIEEELHYWADTVLDMVMDLLGAGVIALYAWRQSKREEQL